MYYLVLKNRENEFIAGLILPEIETNEAISLIFKDKIIEYNWEEDQTTYNASCIFNDICLEISGNCAGVVYSYKGRISNAIPLNLYKTKQLMDEYSIIFEKSWNNIILMEDVYCFNSTEIL